MGIVLKCRFSFTRSGVGLRLCICNKFPGDAPAARAVATPSVVHRARVSVFIWELIRKAHSPSENRKPGDSVSSGIRNTDGLVLRGLRMSFHDSDTHGSVKIRLWLGV